jgi:regulator of replication initiation timing
LKEKLELGKDLDNLKHDIREYLKINQELLYENEYLRQKLGIPITEEIVEDVIKNFSEQIRHR